MSSEAGLLPGFVVYRRLLTGMLQHWRYLLVAVIGMGLYAVSNTGLAAIMQPLLDGSFVKRDPGHIRWVPALILLIFLVRGVGEFLSGYYMALVGRRVVKGLRSRLFGHLLSLPVSFFDASTTGQLISRLTYNVDQITQTATKSLTFLVRDSLTLLGMLGWMFYINWMLAACSLLVGPMVAVLVMVVSRKLRKLSRKMQTSMGNVTQVISETIAGHKVIKAFGSQEYENRRFEDVNERNLRNQMRLVATDEASAPVIQLFTGLSLAGIVFLATFEGILETITVGKFVSFLVAMMLALNPVRNLTKINSFVQRGIAAGQNIYALLERPSEVDQGRFVAERVRGAIDFQDVSFSYDAAKGEALSNVSLHVEPGQVVALVGRSGSGKSTLLNLLPRFYDPQAGSILIDGRDVREYRLENLRTQLAYVSQDVVLFNDSIANNIAYGCSAAQDREKLMEVVRAAHVDEFILKLPQGLDTLIGDRGVLLSGGQRQRIAIARALLKDAPVLLLDEATSALDSEAEQHIQQALQNLVRNRTTLVIAHRLSTIEHADRIIVLHEGRVAEIGTHTELLAAHGRYAQLHRTQFEKPRRPQRPAAATI